MSLSPLGKLSKLQGEVKCKSKVFFFFIVVLNLKGLFLLLNVIVNIANEFLDTIVFLGGSNHLIVIHLSDLNICCYNSFDTKFLIKGYAF